MDLKEKAAYLRGLAEGMNINPEGEGKLFAAIIDILDDMADEIESLNENALDIGEELDALSDDLADVEDFLDELDDDDDWLDFDDDDFDYDDFDDDDFDDDDFGDDDDDFDTGSHCDISDDCCECDGCNDAEYTLDISCPECNAEIEISEEDIDRESVTCPACGKSVDLQIDDVEIDSEDDEVLPF